MKYGFGPYMAISLTTRVGLLEFSNVGRGLNQRLTPEKLLRVERDCFGQSKKQITINQPKRIIALLLVMSALFFGDDSKP